MVDWSRVGPWQGEGRRWALGLAGERACVLCWAQAGVGKHLGASAEPNQGTCAVVWLCRGLATARLQCERRQNLA